MYDKHLRGLARPPTPFFFFIASALRADFVVYRFAMMLRRFAAIKRLVSLRSLRHAEMVRLNPCKSAL